MSDLSLCFYDAVPADGLKLLRQIIGNLLHLFELAEGDVPEICALIKTGDFRVFLGIPMALHNELGVVRGAVGVQVDDRRLRVALSGHVGVPDGEWCNGNQAFGRIGIRGVVLLLEF